MIQYSGNVTICTIQKVGTSKEARSSHGMALSRPSGAPDVMSSTPSGAAQEVEVKA